MVISEHPASEYAVIGTRPIRHDGLDKVTGRAVYGADIHLAGLVYGAVLRSPYPHARIVSIDTSKAEAAPGVLAVMTGADVPGSGPDADRIMASGKSGLPGAPGRGGRGDEPEPGAGSGRPDRGRVREVAAHPRNR